MTRDSQSTTEVLDYEAEHLSASPNSLRGASQLTLVACASVDPAFTGCTVPVPPSGVILGREEPVVLDPSMSRQHARVTPSAQGSSVWVVGLSPKNGCYFRGRTWGYETAFEAQIGDCFRTGGTVWVLARGARDCRSDASQGPSSTMYAALTAVDRLVHKVAEELADKGPVTSTLLITGPRGAGKNRLVQVLVQRLSAAMGHSVPLVDINVSSLHKSTAAADLFGVARGYATGVLANMGAFSSATGGVLLLDEVADLDPAVQPELNTVLSEPYTFCKRGSRSKESIRCLVVSATNSDLSKLMSRGSFREDLYDRLSAQVIHLSGLDDRKEDLLFATRTLLSERGLLPAIPPNIAQILLEASWPGSFRELRKFVDRMVLALRAKGRVEIDSRDLRLVESMMQQLERERAASSIEGDVGLPSRETPARVSRSNPKQTSTLPIPPRGAPTRELFLRIWHDCNAQAARVAETLMRDEKQIRRWAKAFGVDGTPRG